MESAEQIKPLKRLKEVKTLKDLEEDFDSKDIDLMKRSTHILRAIEELSLYDIENLFSNILNTLKKELIFSRDL